MKRVVVVLSGGMDSATALAWMLRGEWWPNSSVRDREHVTTITFNYGSKHNEQENRAAAVLADHFGVHNERVSLPFVNALFKSDLLSSGGTIPDGHYADASMKRTVVPFRNGIMISIAAGYAESIEADGVVLGNHAGDHAIYPDCRPDFTQPMAAAVESGTYARIQVIRPFEQIKKEDIVRLGQKVGVPWGLTYSCYKGGELHCGTCGTCTERREAFRLAGVVDPTHYVVAAR